MEVLLADPARVAVFVMDLIAVVHYAGALTEGHSSIDLWHGGVSFYALGLVRGHPLDVPILQCCDAVLRSLLPTSSLFGIGLLLRLFCRFQRFCWSGWAGWLQVIQVRTFFYSGQGGDRFLKRDTFA